MKESVLPLLCCPACQGDLGLAEASERGGIGGDDVETGAIACARCARRYPVVRGVPRFAGAATVAPDKGATARAFGWEWQEFDRLHGPGSDAIYEEQLLDWIAPLPREHFQDKVVLDAGCGMGRFARIASRFGAREVLAVDLSDAVEPARRNTRDLPNVTVVQGDILDLPIRRADAATGAGGPIDFAYSIGVIHHLPDPHAGFQAIVRHLAPGGSLFVWVYGLENNEWIVKHFSPLREKVLSRLPRRVLYALSLGASVALQVPLTTVYRPLSRSSRLRPLADRLPYGGYLSWLAQFGLRHNHSVIFDHAVAPTAFYVPRDQLEGWFKEAGFQNIQLSWRNRNSWRGFGANRVG